MTLIEPCFNGSSLIGLPIFSSHRICKHVQGKRTNVLIRNLLLLLLLEFLHLQFFFCGLMDVILLHEFRYLRSNLCQPIFLLFFLLPFFIHLRSNISSDHLAGSDVVGIREQSLCYFFDPVLSLPSIFHINYVLLQSSCARGESDCSQHDVHTGLRVGNVQHPLSAHCVDPLLLHHCIIHIVCFVEIEDIEFLL